ncbi:hypothetical protein LSG31_14185 [Fodinisporobacter ferrooxydans]|uniref:Uncharacterized protein n=1 Tax=Fodinisporobacter ferrooxydans TaxID=2901836 RepID=A0ABY4CEW1_9BACL|nr:hypothetical protein LSG31_14185 [Alicyclobacillaceae bacterium MYW30-H2]
MNVEILKDDLKRWGEVIITTGSETFEIHSGDNVQFDTENNLIRLSAPDAEYIICGNHIGFVKKHFGHKVQ